MRKSTNIFNTLLNFRSLQNSGQILLKENKILTSILNSLTEGVIVTNKEGRFTYFNLAAKKILGIGARNISSLEWSDVYGCYKPGSYNLYPSEELPLALSLKGKVIIDEIIFIKNEMQSKGNYISVSSYPLKDNKENINGGVAILHDITEKKALEKELIKNSERFKLLFKGFPIPSYVWQHKGDNFIFIDFNNSAEQFSGNDFQKFIGMNLNEMYKDSVHLNDIYSDLLKCFNEKRNFTRERPYKFLATHEVKELIFNYVFIEPDLILVHTEDITEHAQALGKLKMLNNAIEQTADSVVITDTQGIIQYVNPAFEFTTGYKRNEVIGQTPRILKSGQHDTEFYKKLWDEILNGKSYKGIIVNRKKDGESYISNQTITPMKDEYGKITNFVSVLRDITELKRQQEQEFELQIANELQQRLLKSDIRLPGFDIAGSTYFAVKTGGDYFDFILMEDGSLGIVIADVCGHGISAALMMAETRAFLRIITKIERDPGKILTLINKELYLDLDENHFVTLAFGRLDLNNYLFDYSSAGHIPIYLLNGCGEIENIMESNGIPLGVMSDYKYSTSEKIKLNLYNILVFLTDGILEAKNNNEIELGTNEVLEVVKKYRYSSSKQIIEQIYNRTRFHSKMSNQEDDITSIVCKVKNVL